MKKIMGCFVLCGCMLGCSSSDLSCDSETYVSQCKDETRRYVCTHGEEAYEACVTGYVCREGDNGAACVAAEE